jgi:hypothetical protein
MGRVHILYACVCPAQKIISGNLVLHKHTWHGHIGAFHSDTDFGHVQSTMRDPCFICESKTEKGDWVFINNGNTNEFGDVLRVTVRNAAGVNLVTNAYYSSAVNHGKVIWRRGDG